MRTRGTSPYKIACRNRAPRSIIAEQQAAETDGFQNRDGKPTGKPLAVMQASCVCNYRPRLVRIDCSAAVYFSRTVQFVNSGLQRNSHVQSMKRHTCRGYSAQLDKPTKKKSSDPRLQSLQHRYVQKPDGTSTQSRPPRFAPDSPSGKCTARRSR
jgi:hypothetical protein